MIAEPWIYAPNATPVTGARKSRAGFTLASANSRSGRSWSAGRSSRTDKPQFPVAGEPGAARSRTPAFPRRRSSRRREAKKSCANS